jgi:hypothetical protein
MLIDQFKLSTKQPRFFLIVKKVTKRNICGCCCHGSKINQQVLRKKYFRKNGLTVRSVLIIEFRIANSQRTQRTAICSNPLCNHCVTFVILYFINVNNKTWSDPRWTDQISFSRDQINNNSNSMIAALHNR